MIFALVAIIAIAAVLMMLIILAQDSKSGALSSNFGASQVMGVKRTTDLLEKLTWGFMIGIMVLTMSSKFLIGTGEEVEGPTSKAVEAAKSRPSAPAPAQQQPTVAPAEGTGTTDSAAQK
jgi:preprotein translocase subunit SecG